ncbi:MAG TPA: N-6 DNA methylase [Caproicibacter sp.]|nr:N-6 DNA methylase [Caproicibacter sp.]
MAITTTYEASLLQPLEALISKTANDSLDKYEARLQCLEFWASTIGGFDYNEYCSSFCISPLFKPERLRTISNVLTKLSDKIPMDKSLIISALSREPLERSEQKECGAYYTDFRLASLIGMECGPILSKEKTIADLASGSGALLAATAIAYKKKFPDDIETWLQQHVYAFDMSEYALRGCRTALSTFLTNVKSIKTMVGKWRLMDSLSGDELPVRKFDIIVGNPPWGKIKLSRHSYLLKNGNDHTYGANYDHIDIDKFNEEKKKLADYCKQLREKYEWLKNTESDTYIAFLERSFCAAKADGRVFMLLPAGIIRSKGTYLLREELFKKCSHVNFVVISNHARFFAIDTRFKFLLLACDFSEQSSQPHGIKLAHGNGSETGVVVSDPVTIPLELLKKARPDLTIPEVRTPEELELFFKIHRYGRDWGSSSEWASDITRELDMTNDRQIFATKPNGATIALVEGRMVQQHCFPVKRYVSGSGRAAKWEPSNGQLKSQFWIDPKDLSKVIYARVQRERVGYCDIAGQTNERAMMSAIIPTGVVCGNKVPTIIFKNSHNGRRELLWVGVTNSFVYDWMLRRVISTTANYFLILSVPMPAINIDSEQADIIIAATDAIRKMRSKANPDEAEIARLRCRIDITVADAYGLGFTDLKLILEDFPLLDRKQSPINGEKKSTVTRDYLLSEAGGHFNHNANEYIKRYNLARSHGAIPYIPTDIHR